MLGSDNGLSTTQELLSAAEHLPTGIAHDFNNIMAVITLYSEALVRNPEHPQRQQFLDAINQQAQHATRLVGQLLDFSRRSIVERRPLALHLFLQEVVPVLQRMMPEHIDVSLNAPAGGYTICADPTRLQQVLMNLAINARDAMADGGCLQITLSYFVVEPGNRLPPADLSPGCWARLDVRDTGAGIGREILPYVFEPFFTTKHPGRGTGLGLTQVSGIVRQHGGAITVQSRVGTGSTFTVYLPAEKKEIEATTAREKVICGAKEQEMILLVEDDASMREAIQDTLMMLGYEVLSAESGAEALALFAEHGSSIDLVVSDTLMPNMGGIELFQKLQAQKPDTRVLLMSGYPLQGAGESVLNQSYVHWIQKPFSFNALAEVVRKALEMD